MKKRESQRRERSKLIRFTSSELDIVNERARSCGRPVACYIREVSIGGKPKATAAGRNNEVIRDLARIASVLRRLHGIAVDRALPESAEFGAAIRRNDHWPRRWRTTDLQYSVSDQ
jgi:hypothetical protein